MDSSTNQAPTCDTLAPSAEAVTSVLAKLRQLTLALEVGLERSSVPSPSAHGTREGSTPFMGATGTALAAELPGLEEHLQSSLEAATAALGPNWDFNTAKPSAKAAYAAGPSSSAEVSAGAAAQDLAAALGGASSLAAFPVAPTAGGASSSHASVGSTTGSSPPIRAFAGEGPSAAARALRRESAESAASVATLAAAARAADAVVDVDDGDDGAYVEPSPFPNLYCENLSGGPLHMVVNSTKRISIRNELFEGEALFLMRVPGEPVERHPFPVVFDGKNRTIELQIQGRFLRKPSPGSELYVGAEITAKMQLGMLKKALCNAILSFTRQMMVGVHYSFGDDNDQNPSGSGSGGSTGNGLPHELPHIVAPFVTSCDRLMVTPRGKDPPPLGVPVPEPDSARSLRRSGKPNSFDHESLFGASAGVVTFCFNTMYVDLRDWLLCKIPMMRTMSLADFWGSADLQFVVYEAASSSFSSSSSSTDATTTTSSSSRSTHDLHPQDTNRYAAKLRIYRVENGHCPPVRYGKSFEAEMARRPSFALRQRKEEDALRAQEGSGGRDGSNSSSRSNSSVSAADVGDSDDAFDSCEEGEEDDEEDQGSDQEGTPPVPSSIDVLPGSVSPQTPSSSNLSQRRSSFSTGLKLRSRAAAAAAAVNTVAVASAMAASELRPRRSSSSSSSHSSSSSSGGGLHGRANSGLYPDAHQGQLAEATAASNTASVAPNMGSASTTAGASGATPSSSFSPGGDASLSATSSLASGTSWRCVGWVDLVDRPKTAHSAGKGPHYMLVATTTAAASAEKEEPRMGQRRMQRLVLRTAKECGPLLKICAEAEASERAAFREKAHSDLLNGSYEPSMHSRPNSLLPPPPASELSQVDDIGGSGNESNSEVGGGGDSGLNKASIPAGLVEWSPGGFGTSSSKKSSATSNGNRRKSAGLSKNQSTFNNSDDDDDATDDDDDDEDVIAAAEGTGSRMSLREKQRRQIDRCLRRVFEHPSHRSLRHQNHHASTSSHLSDGKDEGASAIASAASAANGDETHEETGAQNDEALRQYVSIVLDLLPHDESFTPVSTTSTSTFKHGTSDNSSDSSSDSVGDGSSSSSSLGTEILLPIALAPATKSPYGVLKAQPSLLVHAGPVLMAHSEHHWSEAWLAIRHHVLDFYDLTTSGRRTRTLRVAAKDVLAVHCSDAAAVHRASHNNGVSQHWQIGVCPPVLPSGSRKSSFNNSNSSGSCSSTHTARPLFVTIEVETEGRVHTWLLRVQNDSVLDAWLSALRMVLGPVFEARGEWSRQRLAAIEEAQQLSAAAAAAAAVAGQASSTTKSTATTTTSTTRSTSVPPAVAVQSASFDEVLDATLPPGLSTSVSTALSDSRHCYAIVGAQRWKTDNRKVLNARHLFAHNGWSSAAADCDKPTSSSSLDSDGSGNTAAGVGESTTSDASTPTSAPTSTSRWSGISSAEAAALVSQPDVLVAKLLLYVLKRTAEVQGHAFPPRTFEASAAATAAATMDSTPPTSAANTPSTATVLSELGDAEVSSWTFVNFLDRAALLRRVNSKRLRSFNRANQLSFWLNLYHLVTAHAHLLFGAPDSFLQLAKLTTRACYEVGSDVLSLTEIEHGILRAAMALPNQIGATLLIPRGAPYAWKLPFADPRLNFAINCGTVCMPREVPIYRPLFVDRQLDDVVRRALSPPLTSSYPAAAALDHPSEVVGVILKPQRVILPKIMQWYRDDFGGGSSVGLLAFVRKHLPLQMRSELETMLGQQAKHPSFSGSRESSSALSSTVHGQSFTNSSSAAAANGSTDRSNSVLSSSPSQHQPRAVSTTTASSSSHHGSGSWRASFSKAASGGGGGGGSGVAAVEVSEAHAKRVKVRFGEYSGLCRELTLFCI